MAHESLHEPYELLRPETRDMHRAIISLMEELEAIDWYQQRADVAGDPELKAVIEHNRDEEIEHAMMTLEWIRRRNERFDENAKLYLFSEGPITEVEEAMKAAAAEAQPGSETTTATAAKPAAAAAAAPAASASDGSLGVGSLNPSIGA